MTSKKKYKEVIREDYYYRSDNDLVNYAPHVEKTEEEIVKEIKKKMERTTVLQVDKYLPTDDD